MSNPKPPPPSEDGGLVPVAGLCDQHFADLCVALQGSEPAMPEISFADALEEVRQEMDELLFTGPPLRKKTRDALGYVSWVVTVALALDRIAHPPPADEIDAAPDAEEGRIVH